MRSVCLALLFFGALLLSGCAGTRAVLTGTSAEIQNDTHKQSLETQKAVVDLIKTMSQNQQPSVRISLSDEGQVDGFEVFDRPDISSYASLLTAIHGPVEPSNAGWEAIRDGLSLAASVGKWWIGGRVFSDLTETVFDHAGTRILDSYNTSDSYNRAWEQSISDAYKDQRDYDLENIGNDSSENWTDDNSDNRIDNSDNRQDYDKPILQPEEETQ